MYTVAASIPCSATTGASSSSHRANASSHPTSRQVSPVRTIGARSRSGSWWSSPIDAPFGHRKPLLQTSARSPRTRVTCRPSVSISSPHIASQNGQVRKWVAIAEPPYAPPPEAVAQSEAGGSDRATGSRVGARQPTSPVVDRCDDLLVVAGQALDLLVEGDVASAVEGPRHGEDVGDASVLGPAEVVRRGGVGQGSDDGEGLIRAAVLRSPAVEPGSGVDRLGDREVVAEPAVVASGSFHRHVGDAPDEDGHRLGRYGRHLEAGGGVDPPRGLHPARAPQCGQGPHQLLGAPAPARERLLPESQPLPPPAR